MLRFYADFQNDVGDQFRVNIYDNDFSSTATELTLATPGFTLTYEGNNQEQYQPIIASRLEFTLLNYGGDFNTWLNDVLPGAEEGRFPVEVLTDPGEVNEALWWRGMLLPEQILQYDEPSPSAVDFTASDDLVQLKETDMYTALSGTQTSIIGTIHACLKLVRCFDLYASGDTFIRYANDIVPDGYTGSNWLSDGSASFAYIPGTSPTQYRDCYEVLRSIALSYNARVFQAEGIWYFLPMAKYQQRSDTVSYSADLYGRTAGNADDSWSTLSKINWISNQLRTVGGAGLAKMAGNTIEYSRPTKRVTRERIVRASEWLFQYNTNYTTLSSSANDIELADDDRLYFSGSTHLLTLNYNLNINAVTGAENNYINNHTVRADFTIKFGDQYYTDTGWSSTAGTKKVVLAQYYKSFGLDTIGQISVQVPELVDDEVGLDVTLNVVVLNGAGGDIVSTLPTHSVLFLLHVYAGDSAAAIGDSVIYASESSLDNQVTISQTDVIMGNSAVNYVTGGSGVTWMSGTFFSSEYWADWVSSQTATAYSMHRLCVREIMYNTQLPHRIRSGRMYIKLSGSWIWPYHLLSEDSDDHALHEMSYSANDSEVTLERFQLNQSTSNLSFRTDEVNTDNPRDKFIPSGNAFPNDIATNFDDLLTGSVPQFFKVQLIEHSNASSYTIDSDDSNGFMYMNTYVGATNGYGRVYLPKVADNEGRMFRFKTDSTISANDYYQIALSSSEITAGVRIDGNNYADMDRPYDGITLLCYDGQWYIIQRKSK